MAKIKDILAWRWRHYCFAWSTNVFFITWRFLLTAISDSECPTFVAATLRKFSFSRLMIIYSSLRVALSIVDGLTFKKNISLQLASVIRISFSFLVTSIVSKGRSSSSDVRSSPIICRRESLYAADCLIHAWWATSASYSDSQRRQCASLLVVSAKFGVHSKKSWSVLIVNPVLSICRHNRITVHTIIWLPFCAVPYRRWGWVSYLAQYPIGLAVLSGCFRKTTQTTCILQPSVLSVMSLVDLGGPCIGDIVKKFFNDCIDFNFFIVQRSKHWRLIFPKLFIL